MNHVWSDQQLKEAVQAALHFKRSAEYCSEGDPGKVIPYAILSVHDNDHSFEKDQHADEYGFTSMRNDIFEV
jgi:hypothetical protein